MLGVWQSTLRTTVEHMGVSLEVYQCHEKLDIASEQPDDKNDIVTRLSPSSRCWVNDSNKTRPVYIPVVKRGDIAKSIVHRNRKRTGHLDTDHGWFLRNRSRMATDKVLLRANANIDWAGQGRGSGTPRAFTDPLL